jgi:hypothetical protein
MIAANDRHGRARAYCIYIAVLVAFMLLVAVLSASDAYRLLLTILQEQGASEVKAIVVKFAFWYGFLRASGEVLKAVAEFRRVGPPWRHLGPRAFDSMYFGQTTPMAHYISQRVSVLLAQRGADRRRVLVALCDMALVYGFSIWLVFEALTSQALQQTSAMGFTAIYSRFIVVVGVGVGTISAATMLRARMQF